MTPEKSLLESTTQTEERKMSNTLIGYVESFLPGSNFKAYADRVNQLIKVNKIDENEWRYLSQ